MVEQIRLGNRRTVLNVIISRPYANTIMLYFTDRVAPDEKYFADGFFVINDKNKVVGNYGDYSYIFATNNTDKSLSDRQIILTNKKDNVYKDADKQDVVTEISKSLAELRKEKIDELSNICNSIIARGVDVNGEHFSYTIEDQINIKNLFDIASITKQNLPYHSDGNLCRLFTPSEISTIFIEQHKKLIQHTTYFNSLKAYVSSIDNEDELSKVVYGMNLPEKYLVKYGTLMTEAGSLINKAQNILATASYGLSMEAPSEKDIV